MGQELVSAVVGSGLVLGIGAWLFQRVIGAFDARIAETGQECKDLRCDVDRRLTEVRGTVEEVERDVLRVLSSLRDKVDDDRARMQDRFVTRVEWAETNRRLAAIEAKQDQVLTLLLGGGRAGG